MTTSCSDGAKLSDGPEGGGATYLMAFGSLTDLNAVKRAYREGYLAMRRTPACLAKAGCGFAVMVASASLPSVRLAAQRSGVCYRLFRVEPNPDGSTRYPTVDGDSQSELG